MGSEPNILAVRIQARLAELGISPAEATKRAELSKDYIYDIFNGKKSSLRTNNLNNLAKALECDPDYLTGRALAPQSQDRSKYSPNDVNTFVDVQGIIGAGIWTEGDNVQNSVWAYTRAYFPIDKRYSSASQFDMQVQGTSANLFALPSQFIRAVFKYAWPWPLRGGDLVIVHRTQGKFHERSIRRLKESWDEEGVHRRFSLEFDTSDPIWLAQQAPLVDIYGFPLDETENQTTTVEAVILYAYGLGSIGEGRDG